MSTHPNKFRALPVAHIGGTISVPGDKSISHRALMLGAIADGPTVVHGFLASEDCLATQAALTPVQTMRDVLLLNRHAVLAALDDFEETLGDLRAALSEGDGRRLESWLQDAASWRGRLAP